MRALKCKLRLQPIIVYLSLAILCAATASLMGGCDCSSRDHFFRRHDWLCNSRPLFYRGGPYDYAGRLCRPIIPVGDCLLPQFQCFRNSRCIPRRHLCNGIPDCSDGSDEWGCISHTTTTTSTVSTTSSRMYSESTKHTSSDSITTTTILQDNEEKTTWDAFPESGANTSSTSKTAGMTLPHSESNNVLSSSSSTTTANVVLPHSESKNILSSSSTTAANMIHPHSESNNALSSTTSTIIPNSESITTTSSSTTTKTMIPDTESKTAPPSTYTMKIESESNTTTSSFTTTSTMIPDSESETVPSSSTTSTMIPDNESNTVTSSPTTAKKMHSISEENSSISTFATHNTMVLESAEKTSSPTTNNMFPESSAMQYCPDNYCMQNAECIVVEGQYRCKCPYSFIGELCEIKLGSKQGSYQFTVAIVISITLVILCLTAISVCIYRYKRLSSWKFRDMTSRTLSQMTLASNAVE